MPAVLQASMSRVPAGAVIFLPSTVKRYVSHESILLSCDRELRLCLDFWNLHSQSIRPRIASYSCSGSNSLKSTTLVVAGSGIGSAAFAVIAQMKVPPPSACSRGFPPEYRRANRNLRCQGENALQFFSAFFVDNQIVAASFQTCLLQNTREAALFQFLSQRA